MNTKTSRRFHRFIISVFLSIIVWLVINSFIFNIDLKQFIIIEVCIAIGELFSIFVKEQLGLIDSNGKPQ